MHDRSFTTSLAMAMAMTCFGQAGTLDNTFGTEGIVSLWTGNNDGMWSMTVQPDRKILVGGTMDLGSGADFAVLRFLENGDADGSFGISGFSMVDLGAGENDYGNALVLQPDGRIVIAGGSTGRFALARYEVNGDPDPGFGDNGRVITDFGSYGYARALALQPDGRIVAAGSASAPNSMAVARYLADGSLDASFNGTGMVMIPWPDGFAEAHAVAVQADGSIILAGDCATADQDIGMALARLLPDGTLDPSFDDDGRVTVEVGGYSDAALSMVLQPDERILVGGYVSQNGMNNFAAARLNPDGTLDATFADAGTLVAPFGTDQGEAHAITLQPDGKTLLAGRVSGFPYSDMALMRCDNNGAPDLTFDGDGSVITEGPTNNHDVIRAITMQADAKILVAGISDLGYLTVARYGSGLFLATTESPELLTDAVIYPCPVSALMRVRYELGELSAVQCVLYDAQGRTIGDPRTFRLRGEGIHEEVVDISGLAPGPYVLSLQAGDKHIRLPLIKQ